MYPMDRSITHAEPAPLREHLERYRCPVTNGRDDGPAGYQCIVPGAPLNGPVTFAVTQPP